MICLGSNGGRNCPGLKELTVRSLPCLLGCTYCFSRPRALQQDQTGRKKQGYPLFQHPGKRESERLRELSSHKSQQLTRAEEGSTAQYFTVKLIQYVLEGIVMVVSNCTKEQIPILFGVKRTPY